MVVIVKNIYYSLISNSNSKSNSNPTQTRLYKDLVASGGLWEPLEPLGAHGSL